MEIYDVSERLLRQPGFKPRRFQIRCELLPSIHHRDAEAAQTKSLQTKPLDSISSPSLHDIRLPLRIAEEAMSPNDRAEVISAIRWIKQRRAEIRRRGRKIYWIAAAANATAEIAELEKLPKRPPGVHREMQNARLDQLVELRQVAIERAQLEGASRAELRIALPISNQMADRLVRRSKAVLLSREERVWRKVTARRNQKKLNAQALARGETPSGRKLPQTNSRD